MSRKWPIKPFILPQDLSEDDVDHLREQKRSEDFKLIPIIDETLENLLKDEKPQKSNYHTDESDKDLDTNENKEEDRKEYKIWKKISTNTTTLDPIDPNEYYNTITEKKHFHEYDTYGNNEYFDYDEDRNH